MRKFKEFLTNVKKAIVALFKNKQKRRIFILSNVILLTLSIGVLITTICAISYPDYIYIEDEDDLNKIRENLDGEFVFTKQNINIENEWIPIGTEEKPFTGTILGNDCTISFIKKDFNFIENEKCNYFGFFGNNSGTIKNLQFYLHEMNINANNEKETIFGCVSAFNSGSISNCKIIQASGSINLSSYKQLNAGAFCGVGAHNFVKLRSSTNFSLSSNDKIFAGGLVGVINDKADIWECESIGRVSINSSSEMVCGGLVGFSNYNSSVIITNCSSRNTFVSSNGMVGQCGGVVGKSLSNNFEINKVYSNCNITNYENVRSSNFVCEGNFDISDCVSNPNFINQLDNFIYGSFAYKILDHSSFKNCYFTKSTVGSFDNYGELMPLDNITFEMLKWDNKIWRKNSDGSFGLI